MRLSMVGRDEAVRRRQLEHLVELFPHLGRRIEQEADRGLAHGRRLVGKHGHDQAGTPILRHRLDGLVEIGVDGERIAAELLGHALEMVGALATLASLAGFVIVLHKRLHQIAKVAADLELGGRELVQYQQQYRRCHATGLACLEQMLAQRMASAIAAESSRSTP